MTLVDKKELLMKAVESIYAKDKYPVLSPLVYGEGISFTVDFNGYTGLHCCIHLLSQKEVNFECDFAFHVKHGSSTNEELCVAFRKVPASEGGTGHEFYVYTAWNPDDEERFFTYQFTCKAPMGDIIDDKSASLTGLDRIFAGVAVYYTFIVTDNGSQFRVFHGWLERWLECFRDPERRKYNGIGCNYEYYR